MESPLAWVAGFVQGNCKVAVSSGCRNWRFRVAMVWQFAEANGRCGSRQGSEFVAVVHDLNCRRFGLAVEVAAVGVLEFGSGDGDDLVVRRWIVCSNVTGAGCFVVVCVDL